MHLLTNVFYAYLDLHVIPKFPMIWYNKSYFIGKLIMMFYVLQIQLSLSFACFKCKQPSMFYFIVRQLF